MSWKLVGGAVAAVIAAHGAVAQVAEPPVVEVPRPSVNQPSDAEATAAEFDTLASPAGTTDYIMEMGASAGSSAPITLPAEPVVPPPADLPDNAR